MRIEFLTSWDKFKAGDVADFTGNNPKDRFREDKAKQLVAAGFAKETSKAPAPAAAKAAE